MGHRFESCREGTSVTVAQRDSKPVGRGSIPRSRQNHAKLITVMCSNPVGSTNKISYDPSSAKKEEKVYTGTEIIGIAQMHKSNAVPVRGKKQATEVATMREIKCELKFVIIILMGHCVS